MSASRINDGYSLPFEIPARGPWPALKGMYRLALPERVYEYTLSRKDTPRATMQAIVKLLAPPDGHIISWDLCDDRGEVTAVTADALRKLPHPDLEKLVDYVCGYSVMEAEADVKNS